MEPARPVFLPRMCPSPPPGAAGAPIGGVLFSLEEACSVWSRRIAWRCFIACTIAVVTHSQAGRAGGQGRPAPSGPTGSQYCPACAPCQTWHAPLLATSIPGHRSSHALHARELAHGACPPACPPACLPVPQLNRNAAGGLLSAQLRPLAPLEWARQAPLLLAVSAGLAGWRRRSIVPCALPCLRARRSVYLHILAGGRAAKTRCRGTYSI